MKNLIGYEKSFGSSNEDQRQKFLNELYAYHDTTTKYMHRARMNLFVDLITELIEEKTITSFENAIDIGCNAGWYSKMISDFGFRDVMGVDIDEKLIKKAQKEFTSNKEGKHIHFHLLNAEHLDTSKKFNFLLCTEVVEHTDHPELVIENIKNSLAPGGVAVITLPNAVSFPYLLHYLSQKIQGKPLKKELIDHLSYPFYKSLNLFITKDIKLVKTTGTNLFYWNFMYKLPFFSLLNKINFYMSRWPVFKYFTQFFFIVVQKEK
jgi:2-polyprenyl-3-methyl-5-hydroxy-6-metoxy-1,4-benzoquinol methylase